MDSYSCIAKHSLDTGGGYNNLFAWVFLKLVGEEDKNTELDLLGVAWYLQVCSLLNILVVYLNIGDGCLEDG